MYKGDEVVSCCRLNFQDMEKCQNTNTYLPISFSAWLKASRFEELCSLQQQEPYLSRVSLWQ